MEECFMKNIMKLLGIIVLVSAIGFFMAACEGPMGPEGIKGEQGETGAKGDQGDKGDTGAKGDQGDKGDTGDKGDQGDTGLNSYIVIFNANGGSPRFNFVSVLHGNTIIAPPAPTKSGYESKFDGWYTEREFTTEWDFATNTVTANITLYAKWVAYEIGDTGPAGGIIFYVDEDGFTVQGYAAGSGETEHLNFAEYTAYYLEAAPENMAYALRWATGSGWSELIPDLSESSSDQTDWAIGRGRMNTAIIIARGINQSYTTPAANACVDLRTGNKDDWFLPSRNELNAFAQIRGQHGIPNTGWFWSSSQNYSNFAWYLSFSDGFLDDYSKSNNGSCRAVRAF